MVWLQAFCLVAMQAWGRFRQSHGAVITRLSWINCKGPNGVANSMSLEVQSEADHCKILAQKRVVPAPWLLSPQSFLSVFWSFTE